MTKTTLQVCLGPENIKYLDDIRQAKNLKNPTQAIEYLIKEGRRMALELKDRDQKELDRLRNSRMVRN